MDAWMKRRRWPIIVAVVGPALALPSLGAGWLLDDHHLRLRLRTPAPFAETGGSPLLTLFTFADGVPENNRRLMDIGFWPWWTLPTIKGSFFRPLTAISHWVDHALWPNSALLMHLHSLFWFAGVIFASAILYRRILGKVYIAGLAALLYAIDDAHCLPAAWLANRNALMAAFFGLLAIIVHDRWRRDGWTFGAVIAPTLLLLSLLSKEAGVATCGYLFAYAIFLDKGSWRRRVTSLCPYLAVVVGWRIVWLALGYGVSPGFLIYVDPLQEPLRYLVAIVERAPIYLAGQLFLPPADAYVLCSWFGAERLLWACGVVVLVLLGVVVTARLTWDGPMRFFVLGMMLSLLPICAAMPGDRMLLFVGFGAFAIVAKYLRTVYPGAGTATPGVVKARARRMDRLLAALLVVVHLILAPIVLAVRSAIPLGPASLIEPAYVDLPDDLDLTGKTVVVVSAPIPIVAGYLPERRALDGLTIPAHTRVLGPSIADEATVFRSDSHTLVVCAAGGLIGRFSQLARSTRYPMHVGQKVELTGMTAEVLTVTSDGQPTEAAFTFDVPLEDPSLIWVHFKDAEFEPFALPAIGETINLAHQPG